MPVPRTNTIEIFRRKAAAMPAWSWACGGDRWSIRRAVSLQRYEIPTRCKQSDGLGALGWRQSRIQKPDFIGPASLVPAPDCVCCYEAIFQWWQIVQRQDQKANRVGRFHIELKDAIGPAARRRRSRYLQAAPPFSRSSSKQRQKGRLDKSYLSAMGAMMVSLGAHRGFKTQRTQPKMPLLFHPSLLKLLLFPAEMDARKRDRIWNSAQWASLRNGASMIPLYSLSG